MGNLPHTPGPWTLRDGDFVDAPSRMNVAQVRGAHLPHEPELQANAHLIAASPELLDAIKEVCGDLGFAEWASPEHAEVILLDLIKKWHPLLTSAIAKAEGR